MYQQWEFNLLYWFQKLHGPLQDKLAIIITHLGSGGVFWIAVTLLLLVVQKDRRVGISMAFALATEVIICNVILKNAVQRDRPCWIDTSVELLVKSPSDYSFPSGHSSASFAAAVALLMYDRKWGTAAVILAVLIGLSRLYLFVHFPTDVLAGALIGTVMGIICSLVVKRYGQRFSGNGE